MRGGKTTLGERFIVQSEEGFIASFDTTPAIVTLGKMIVYRQQFRGR
jgi:hypothetical protein